jgi:hypothetical protein
MWKDFKNGFTNVVNFEFIGFLAGLSVLAIGFMLGIYIIWLILNIQSVS